MDPRCLGRLSDTCLPVLFTPASKQQVEIDAASHMSSSLEFRGKGFAALIWIKAAVPLP